MAQHNAGLEKVWQTALKHKQGGTEMASTILAIEALVASGIDTAAVVKNTDADIVRRLVGGLAHRSYGEQSADAVSTLDAIIAEESLTLVAKDKEFRDRHLQGLRSICKELMTRKEQGYKVANIADLAEQVVDELLVIYGVGGAKDDAPTAANLATIKAALA